eukprot:g6828.t1
MMVDDDIQFADSELTTRDKVVRLLNQANASSDYGTTLKNLKEIEELLLKRTDVDEDERSSLLYEFTESIVEFHLKPNVNVKCFVVSFIETLAKLYPEQILKVIDSFIILSSSNSGSNEKLIKKTLQTGIFVYRRTLNLLCTQSGKASDEDLKKLRETLLGHMNSEKDVVRNLTVKFKESVILCYSEVTTDANTVKTSAKNTRMSELGADWVSLSDIPQNIRDDCREIGKAYTQELVKMIIDTIKTSKYSTNIIRVVFSTLTSLGVHRSALMSIILPEMLSSYSLFNDKKESLEQKQVKIFQTCFKNTFLKLLKLTTSVEWHEDLFKYLVELGAEAQAEKAREASTIAAVQSKNRRRARKSLNELEKASKKRRIDIEVYQGPWPPKSNCVDIPTQNLSLLTTDEVVGTVIYCMSFLPPPPPPPDAGPHPSMYENTGAPLKKLMHSLKPLQKNVSSSSSTTEAISFVNHYSFNKSKGNDKIAGHRVELPDLNNVMSKLDLKDMNPFLKYSNIPSDISQNLWHSTIFGGLCNVKTEWPNKFNAACEFLSKKIDASTDYNNSGFDTTFWYLFLTNITLSLNIVKDFGPEFLLQHQRFNNVVVSMLPLFAEKSILHFNDDMASLESANYTAAERYLDFLKIVATYSIPFRKRYIEFLFKVALKTNSNFSKKCINQIINHWSEKKYFQMIIRDCVHTLLKNKVANSTAIQFKSPDKNFQNNMLELTVCRIYLLLCLKDARMLKQLLDAYAGGTVLGRQAIIRGISSISWRLAGLTEEKKVKMVNELRDFSSKSSFLVVNLIRSLNLQQSIIGINAVKLLVGDPGKKRNFWPMVPLLPYLSRDEFAKFLADIILEPVSLWKATFCVILKAVELHAATLSLMEYMVSLYLLKCPTKKELQCIIQCDQYCLKASPNMYTADFLKSCIEEIFEQEHQKVPLFVMRLVIRLQQKSHTANEQSYVISILHKITEKVKDGAEREIYFKGIKHCIGLMSEDVRKLEDIERLEEAMKK